MEIDLGDEARTRNIAMTERARRRLKALAADDPTGYPSSDAPEEEGGDGNGDGDNPADRGKTRKTARDGKPLARRRRDRRGSEDIERDRLVEQFLRENRLDVYDVPDPNQPHANLSVPADGPDDEPLGADDRLVEEFRREFLESISLRRRQQQQAAARRRAQPAPAGGSYNSRVEKGEVLRGPKLGGSRNERAAMRDLLLQKERDKKAPNRR